MSPPSRAVQANIGARFLVRGGKFETAEGGSRARNVVIEFPELSGGARLLQIARISGAHQAAPAALHVDIMIIEGYDGPQP